MSRFLFGMTRANTGQRRLLLALASQLFHLGVDGGEIFDRGGAHRPSWAFLAVYAARFLPRLAHSSR